MTTFFKTKRFSPWADQFLTHVRLPLFRNGYSLVTSAAITSGLGMLYWILAARNYDVEVIGLNSALISTMIFLASLSQLNLANALIRFIPNSGKSAGRFILFAYLASILVALVAGSIFILGSALWSPTLYAYFQANPGLAVWFVVATMGWCVFALQDSAMTGLRQATWVPLENLVFAAGKIGLLVAFAGVMTHAGLFASWSVSVFALLLPVNLLIFKRLVPRHQRSSEMQPRRIVPGDVARYVVGDYVASFFWMAATDLLPLLVVEMVGTEANAYFYLAWTIAYSLYLVSRSMGLSLISEAAADENRLFEYSYHILVQNGRLILLALFILLPGAPLILRLFGQSYADAGSGLLQLLCLSALPNIVTALYVSILRVQKRMKALLLLLAALCLVVVSTSVVLLPLVGIIGVGIAWLVGQTAVAGFLLLTELRPVWLPHVNTQRLLKALSYPRAVLRLPATFLRRLAVQRTLKAMAHAAGGRWRVERLVGTEADMVVAFVQSEGGGTAVFKTAKTKAAAQSLTRQANNLQTLRQHSGLNWLKPLLPAVLNRHNTRHGIALLEEKLPGLPIKQVINDTNHKAILEQAAIAIFPLHFYTAAPRTVDAALFQQWVTSPLQTILTLPTWGGLAGSRANHAHHLRRILEKELPGTAVTTSWIHGDFAPGNILTSEDGAAITGIIDWELAQPDGLPQIDLVQLFVTMRMLQTGEELGTVVNALYQSDNWFSIEQDLLEQSFAVLKMPAINKQTLLLLTWLHHISANLTKANRFRHNPLWIAKNVDCVLHMLEAKLRDQP